MPPLWASISPSAKLRHGLDLLSEFSLFKSVKQWFLRDERQPKCKVQDRPSSHPATSTGKERSPLESHVL
jgi:hypothetical protein